MENWKLTNLGDVANFVRGPFGGSLKKEFFVDEGYAVYEQQHAIRNQFHSVRYFIDENKFNEMKRFELHENDIIMSCSGTMGKVAMVPNNIQKGIINQALLKISPSNKLDSKFLENYMKSVTFLNYLNAEVKGVAIKNVASVKELKQIPILLPPLSEQQAIVEKLDFAFDAIEKAKANIEKNIENAKELFQSKLNAIFSQKGEGWEEKKIEEVCESIVAGGDAPKNNFSPEKTDEYPIPIYANAVKLNGLYGYTNLSKIKRPSLSIAARGSGTGFTCIRLQPFFPIVRLLVLTPNELIDLKFLKLAVDNQVIKASGSAIPQFTVPMLKMLNIYLPETINEQRKIVNQLDQIFDQTNLLQEKYKIKLANLDELKKSILEKAFKGELV